MQSLQKQGALPLSARSSSALASRPLPCPGAPRQGSSRSACVVYADKGKRRGRATGPAAQQTMQAPPMPAVDPENAQLVIFVRSKVLKRWMPLNVLNGGAQANALVKGMEVEFTKETSTNTLKREVARMIYKERVQMEETVRKSFPPMKFVKEFEYGMCVLDRVKVRESVLGNLGVMVLPAEEEIGQTPVESVAAGAAGVAGNLVSGFKSFMDGLSSGSPGAAPTGR